MKLIEKLAQEWVRTSQDAEIMDTDSAHENTFLAGFRKAREMAAGKSDMCVETMMRFFDVLGPEQLVNSAKKHLELRFNGLGEEEVPDGS